ATEEVLHQVQRLPAIEKVGVASDVALQIRTAVVMKLVDDRGSVHPLVPAAPVSEADVLAGRNDLPIPAEVPVDVRVAVLDDEDASAFAGPRNVERGVLGVEIVQCPVDVDDLRLGRRAPAGRAAPVARAGGSSRPASDVPNRVRVATAGIDSDVRLLLEHCGEVSDHL